MLIHSLPMPQNTIQEYYLAVKMIVIKFNQYGQILKSQFCCKSKIQTCTYSMFKTVKTQQNKATKQGPPPPLNIEKIRVGRTESKSLKSESALFIFGYW